MKKWIIQSWYDGSLGELLVWVVLFSAIIYKASEF